MPTAPCSCAFASKAKHTQQFAQRSTIRKLPFLALPKHLDHQPSLCHGRPHATVHVSIGVKEAHTASAGYVRAPKKKKEQQRGGVVLHSRTQAALSCHLHSLRSLCTPAMSSIQWCLCSKFHVKTDPARQSVCDPNLGCWETSHLGISEAELGGPSRLKLDTGSSSRCAKNGSIG